MAVVSTHDISFENDANKHLENVESTLKYLLNLEDDKEMEIKCNVMSHFSHPIFGIKTFMGLSMFFKKTRADEIQDVYNSYSVEERRDFFIFELGVHAYMGNFEILSSLGEFTKMTINSGLEKYGKMTPLHFAVMRENNSQCINELRKRGAEIGILNDQKQNVLHIIALKERYENLESILSFESFEEKYLFEQDNKGQSFMSLLLEDGLLQNSKNIILQLSSVLDLSKLKELTVKNLLLHVEVLKLENQKLLAGLSKSCEALEEAVQENQNISSELSITKKDLEEANQINKNISSELSYTKKALKITAGLVSELANELDKIKRSSSYDRMYYNYNTIYTDY